MNEEVFQLLSRDCQWDLDRFHSWATALLSQQLVGTAANLATPVSRRHDHRSMPPLPDSADETTATALRFRPCAVLPVRRERRVVKRFPSVLPARSGTTSP
jgi:hypothetical protein